MAENQQNQQSAAAPPLPYFDFSTYLKERYGGPVVRIPVDIGFGCPHRQGEDGRGAGGCDFCGDDGSRAAYLGDRKTVAEQVQAGLTLDEKRQAGEKYFLMAYLQAYTSTHDPLKQLRQKIAEVLAQAEFKIITLSTQAPLHEPRFGGRSSSTPSSPGQPGARGTRLSEWFMTPKGAQDRARGPPRSNDLTFQRSNASTPPVLAVAQNAADYSVRAPDGLDHEQALAD